MLLNSGHKWHTSLFINNTDVSGAGEAIQVDNPATEALLVEFAGASSQQVASAVGAARGAFDSGRWDDAGCRREALHRLADLLEAHADAFMAVLVEELGTPVSNRATQIEFPIKLLRWNADAATRDRTEHLGRYGSRVPSDSVLAYRPVGVVAAITAYNYPILISAAKLGAALAAGCTTVLLSSPLAPLAVLMLGSLIRKAGFPPGVVNIIAGDAAVGRALTESEDIDKITFTGSVAVGRSVMQQAAKGIRGVVLELGGKSAAILLPGADIKSISFPLHARYLRNAGQGCGSPTRILVPHSRFDEFVDLSREAYARMPVGNPYDPKTMAGPLITERHRERVEGAVQSAVATGAQIVAGGGRPPEPRGWYMNPTLVAGVDNRSAIAREELFGPVGVVMTYQDTDEAVAIANDSSLGLKGYLFGPEDDCFRIAPRLRVGTVLINGGGDARPDGPLSGSKQSGIGCEWGEAGLREFLETQHIQKACVAS